MEIPEVIREKARDFKEKELEEYITRVNNLLLGMQPGNKIEIDKVTKEKNRDLFIECVKFYMREHAWQDGLSFVGGFSALRKYDLSFLRNPKGKKVTV
jgi:hypothetical protein